MKNKYYFHFRPIGVMRLCLALICLLWFGALVLRAATHYVVPYNEAQANPYTSWGTAGTNIIDVVNAAMTNTPSRLVWVSNGVYVLTNQIVITNELTLQNIDGHGPEDTIINGNFTPGTPETNRCLCMSNASAFVQGLTFSNGACMPPAANIGGGGVRMYSGTLSNCTVRNNLVVLPANLSYGDNSVGGGGVYMSGGTAMVCRVTDNIVTNLLQLNGFGSGGGIWAKAGLVDGCLISNNIIYYGDNGNPYYCGFGGGVYIGASGKVRSCIICRNRTLQSAGSYSGDGGGVILRSDSAIMEGCTVTLNQAASQAGGVRIDSGTITNCVISYNKDTVAVGGLYLFTDSPDVGSRVFNTTIANNTGLAVRVYNTLGVASLPDQLVNCVITNNSGWGINTWIGAYVQKKIVISNCVISGNQGGVGNFHLGTIQNCLIANNTGTVGGLTIYKGCSTVSVSSCTVTKNRDTDSSGSGLYIDATNASLSISSCIIYTNGLNGTDDVYDARAPTNYDKLSYSCIGANPGFTGARIIVANPQFINPAGENFRLSDNSPCINAGTNQSWMTNSYDLDSLTRIRYGTVDMGAYELIHSGTIYLFR